MANLGGDDAEDFDDLVGGDTGKGNGALSYGVDTLGDFTGQGDDLFVGVGDLRAVFEDLVGGGEGGLGFEDRLSQLDLAADGLVEETIEGATQDTDSLFDGKEGESGFGQAVDQATGSSAGGFEGVGED